MLSESNSNELPICRASDLDQGEDHQQWLIRSIWGRTSVGILGGSPKCCKTFLGLEMAVSVASATPCLQQFEVEDPGPVLAYLAEDALPELRERVEGISKYHKITMEALPLYVITAPILRLDQPLDQQRLAATLQRIRPRLLLLDPLVRLHRLNENRASDISWILGYLRELQRTFDLAVILVHHVGKRARADLGQALRGSTDLHAFGDSNAYLQRREQNLVLSVEHRFAPACDPIALKLISDPNGQAHLEITSFTSSHSGNGNSLANAVLAQLKKDQKPLGRGVLRQRLKVNNQRLGETLQELQDQRRIHRVADGWALVAPKQANQPINTASPCEYDQPILFTLSGKTESGSGGVQAAKG